MDPPPEPPLARPPVVRWTEVCVLVPRGWTEVAAGALADTAVSGGFVVGPNQAGAQGPPAGFELVRTYLRDECDDAAQRAHIRARLAALAELCAEPELARTRVEFHALPPEDYATSWRKSWKPFRVLRLSVIPPWRTAEQGAQPRPGDTILRLEPGGAFGSGRHATTRTCLKVLQERLGGGEHVLDAGSGSGILSVAAVLLGARASTGFDVQPEARAYAESLARDNAVQERCHFRTGGFETLAPGELGFDVVLANIYSDILQAEAANLAGRLAAGGWFAFSGCPLHHVDATRHAIREAGLAIEAEPRRGRWSTFVGVHA